MKFEYKKKGRIIGRNSSPRDLQRRNSNTEKDTLDSKLIIDLLEKVSSMTLEIENLKRGRVETHPATVISSNKKYTEEEFNEELTKALKKELVIAELKLEARNDKINALEFKIETLVEINNTCGVSSTKHSKYNKESIEVGKRPIIEESVIDPTEELAELDPHINIKEVKEDKTNMMDKVGKLKALLGGN